MGGNSPRQMSVASGETHGVEKQQARAAERMQALFGLVRQRKSEIVAVLPDDVPYEKFEAVLMMAIRREPRLLDAYGPSVIRAAIQSAYDGLLPDGNQAVILISNNKVPGTGQNGQRAVYRDEARYQSMVYGLRLQLVQSGAVSFIDAKNVYAKEHFRHEEGLNPVLEHKPILDPEARGDRIATYAIARLPNGEKVFDVLSKGDVMAAREVAKTKSVWDGPFGGEMWKKTAIRRLRKAIPSTRPYRDAEALEMFPQYAPQAPALPAPARPTRADFQPALEHHDDSLDLTAFGGGGNYSDDKEHVERDQGRGDDQAREEKRKAAPKREEKPKPAAKKSESQKATDQGTDNNQPPAGDREPETPREPKNADEWDLWADELRTSIGECTDLDKLKRDQAAQEPIIAKAPKHLAEAVNTAFSDRITDLMMEETAGDQGGLGLEESR